MIGGVEIAFGEQVADQHIVMGRSRPGDGGFEIAGALGAESLFQKRSI